MESSYRLEQAHRSSLCSLNLRGSEKVKIGVIAVITAVACAVIIFCALLVLAQNGHSIPGLNALAKTVEAKWLYVGIGTASAAVIFCLSYILATVHHAKKRLSVANELPNNHLKTNRLDPKTAEETTQTTQTNEHPNDHLKTNRLDPKTVEETTQTTQTNEHPNDHLKTNSLDPKTVEETTQTTQTTEIEDNKKMPVYRGEFFSVTSRPDFIHRYNPSLYNDFKTENGDPLVESRDDILFRVTLINNAQSHTLPTSLFVVQYAGDTDGYYALTLPFSLVSSAIEGDTVKFYYKDRLFELTCAQLKSPDRAYCKRFEERTQILKKKIEHSRPFLNSKTAKDYGLKNAMNTPSLGRFREMPAVRIEDDRKTDVNFDFYINDELLHGPYGIIGNYIEMPDKKAFDLIRFGGPLEDLHLIDINREGYSRLTLVIKPYKENSTYCGKYALFYNLSGEVKLEIIDHSVCLTWGN